MVKDGESAAATAGACRINRTLCMRRQTRMASQAGLSAGVRLMRLEVLATRQGAGAAGRRAPDHQAQTRERAFWARTCSRPCAR